MTPEEVWRQKSDEALLAASTRLAEYTAEGQVVILAEIQRRRALGSIADTVVIDAEGGSESASPSACCFSISRMVSSWSLQSGGAQRDTEAHGSGGTLRESHWC